MKTSRNLLKGSLIRKALSLVSLKRKTVTPSSNQPAQSSGSGIASNLYHRCSDLPLDIFIDCEVDKAYHRLIRHGTAPFTEAVKAWQMIYDEYSDLLNDVNSRTIKAVVDDFNHTNTKLHIIRGSLVVLSHTYSEQAVKRLRNLGYKYQFNPENLEQYKKDLEAVNSKSKSLELVMEIKKKQYGDTVKKYEGKSITKKDWLDQIAVVSEFMKFRINAKEVTVSEYISYRQLMERSNEQTRREIEKLKSKR